MRPALTLSVLAALFFCSTTLVAQETSAEDPFADYSYLWEKDSKKKKKKKDKSTKAEEKPAALPGADLIQPQSNVSDTIPASSTQPLDSLSADSPAADSPAAIQADTLQPVDTLPPMEQAFPVDTTDVQAEPVEEIIDESPDADENLKEKKEKRERRETAPVPEDFRAGLPADENSKGSFTGGVTYTKIGDESFVGMMLSPEFKIWKVGIGLNVPVLYGLESKKIRTEIFEGGVGAARLVRYLRLGNQKRDPYYVRVGELTNTMIGFGGLINNYSNTTSYEKRKVGLHYDFNVLGLAGLEGMYSDFDPASLNLLAVRPYVRPLAWTIIPVARTLEIGATIIRDKDQTRQPLSDSTYRVNSFTADGIGAFGLDAGINLLRIPFIQIDAFFNYSRLNVSTSALTDSLTVLYTAEGNPQEFTNGSGVSGGINFRFHFIANILSTDVRIERLSYNNHYLPQFFDVSYEMNKDARLLSLRNAPKMSGIYGSLTGHVLDKVQLGGSLLLPDAVSDESPAVLRLNADLERLGDKVSLHGSYIKANLSDLADAFKLDDNSLAKVRFIYHMNKFLAVGVDYYWAFAPTEDGSYEATHYVAPYFGVSVKF